MESGMVDDMIQVDTGRLRGVFNKSLWIYDIIQSLWICLLFLYSN